MKKLWLLPLILITQLVWSQQKKETPYVILISFDGFRHDYIARYNLPNFKKFIKEGTTARGLIPSFPSKTFPNHYSLVTGLTPGHHGLVDNQFYDPAQRKMYSSRDKVAVNDPSFYHGDPLWQVAKKQGVKSASFFWVASDVQINGALPDYFLKYDEKVPDKKRVDQTIAWLELPATDRPHFISLYFSFTDTQGHNTGPNSKELEKAVVHADSLVGAIKARVARLKLPVNIILVSDHGMLELKQEEDSYITLPKLYNPADTTVICVNGGTQAHFYTMKADSLYNALKPQEEANHFKLYKRSEFPERWQYDSPRAGDVLLVADPGYYIQQNAGSWERGAHGNVFGAHGYDPYVVSEMQGIFCAQGPNIKKGIVLEPFVNVHVYPLIAKILKLKIPPVDGNIQVLQGILK